MEFIKNLIYQISKTTEKRTATTQAGLPTVAMLMLLKCCSSGIDCIPWIDMIDIKML